MQVQFSERLRMGLGAVDAMRWNAARLDHYLGSISQLRTDDDRWDDWVAREERELVKGIIRSQYALVWCSPKGPHLYKESAEAEASRHVLDHAIPISQLCNAILGAEPQRRSGVLFLSWLCPVVRVSKASDIRVQKGESKRNKTPSTPFKRFERFGISIEDADGEPCNARTFEEHLYYVETRTSFGGELFQIARQEYNLEAALEGFLRS